MVALSIKYACPCSLHGVGQNFVIHLFTVSYYINQTIATVSVISLTRTSDEHKTVHCLLVIPCIGICQ